jgi:potassium efflux system protein
MGIAVEKPWVHRHVLTAATIVLLAMTAVAPVVAQSSGEPSIPTPTATPQPTPIPAADIPTLAAADAEIARKAVVSAAPDAQIEEIRKSLPAVQDRIEELRDETLNKLKMPGPASMIKDSENSWDWASDQLSRWLTDLTTRSAALDASLDDLQDRISLWQLTQRNNSVTALPDAVRREITNTIRTLTDAGDQVRSARDSILDLQATISEQQSDVDEMLVQLQEEISQRTAGVLGVDSPPLWTAFGTDADRRGALAQFKMAQQEHWRSFEDFAQEKAPSLLLWFLTWPVLTAFMVVMRRNAETWALQDASLNTAVRLLSRPYSAAIVLTTLLFVVVEPKAPSAWTSVIGLITVVASVRLLLNLLPAPMRLAPTFVALLFVLRRVVVLTSEGFLISRLALLALAAAGVGVSIWLIRVIRANPDLFPTKWHRVTLFGAQLTLTSFAVGVVANIVGSVDFSILLLTGTTHALLTVFLWWLVDVLLRSMVRVGLLTDTARRWGFAPAHSETVRATLFPLTHFLMVVAWLAGALSGFLLLDPLITAIRRALDWRINVGNVSIDPGDLLIFGFIIWLALKIATLVEFVINVDLMPKAHLPRGVPETISRLTSYIVIAIGAVIASAAAGFDISKITIVIGALGVGIGFGLQNIVNNFVSGLILLFERPIRVGDILELDDTRAVVETIGMRASIVTTRDGAEIIVPNADLISQKVINWTLSNDRHRMEIPVGVGYDSDPDQVAELILAIANDHKDVDSQPQPTCLFIEFGDSSLNFELRAWTSSLSSRIVASELRFEIFRKLREAGIVFPFPQRDIHVRSSDRSEAAPGDVHQSPGSKPSDRPSTHRKSSTPAKF